MSYSYQFCLKIIKLVTEQDFKLRQRGFHLNHKTVLKLMNELGIHSILRKKRHGKRGKTSHIAPNLLNRDFTATALNQK